MTQAVGRVMRKAKGKDRGYIIIPVAVNTDRTDDPAQAAKDILESGNFADVWKVVRALRSHDERIDYWVSNPASAAKNAPVEIRVAPGVSSDPVFTEQLRLQLYDTLNQGFASMLVDAVGDKEQYATWGQNAAKVAKQIQRRLDSMLPDTEAGLAEWENHELNADDDIVDDSDTSKLIAAEFHDFLAHMRKAVSPNITYDELKEMVAQHVVTIPVFDVMFRHSGFADSNPVSKGIAKLLRHLPDRDGDDDGHPFSARVVSAAERL